MIIGGISASSCSSGSGPCPSVQLYELGMTAGPFYGIPNTFNPNNCMSNISGGLGSNQSSKVNWSELFDADYTISVSVQTTDCPQGEFKETTNYCFYNNGANLVDQRWTSNINSGNPYSPGYPVSFSERLNVRIPVNRKFRLTVLIYTNCDQCTIGSSQSQQYFFLGTKLYNAEELRNHYVFDLGILIWDNTFSTSCSTTCS
jgi:hypothetical protein